MSNKLKIQKLCHAVLGMRGVLIMEILRNFRLFYLFFALQKRGSASPARAGLG
jgi:hypothetical protein